MPMTSDLPSDKPWLPTGDIQMNSLNLSSIALSAKVQPCIRGLALHLMTCDSPYCNIGFFFKSLPDIDLLYLLELCSTADQQPQYATEEEISLHQAALQEMTLLAFLLGRAEGETDMNPEYMKDAFPALCTLIKVEHYCRGNASVVNRMNYSLTTCDRIILDSKTALEMQEYFREF
jgi:hypothetical protein